MNNQFPFVNHPLATKTQSLNWLAVTALAEQEFDQKVLNDLRMALSCIWDAERCMFVTLDKKNPDLAAAVAQANADTVAQCRTIQEKSDNVANHQASESLRNTLLCGRSPEYVQFFARIGVTPDEILRHFDLVVSQFGRFETDKQLGIYGAMLSSPEHRRIFVSGDLEGLKYLSLCYFPGLSSGLYFDIGHTLNRICINILIGENSIYKYTMTRVVVDAIRKAGFDLFDTMLNALQGHPEKLYNAIENEYGLVGLGQLLMVQGSDFFTSKTHDVLPRYATHYECCMEYFEEFGYHLDQYGN